MDVDQALAGEPAVGLGRGLADDPDEGAARVALDAKDRVGHEVRGQAVLSQRGQRRVEQVRTVVVDHLDHGDLARLAVALDRGIAQPQPCRIARPPGHSQESASIAGEVGEHRGGIRG